MKLDEFADRTAQITQQIQVVGLALEACAIAEKRPKEAADYLPYIVGAQAGLIVALIAAMDSAHALLLEVGRGWPGPKS